MTTISLMHDKQSGAALPVALVMLLVSTILGLASMRSATTQEKMSANMYDRSLAYQSAEAALRAAEDKILSSTDFKVGCAAQDGDFCPSIPPETFNGESDDWTNITASSIPNTEVLSSKAQPQYYIESMALTGGIDELSKGRSANDDTYESAEKSAPQARLYRVTARSHDPSKVKNRSIVVLQTIVKKNI